MNYRLIVSDVDGTLVDGRQNITEKTKKLVEEFQKKGGYFTLATGRTECSSRFYRDMLGINGPVILYNGSKIYDSAKDSVHFEITLEYSVAKCALDLLKKYDLHPILYYDKKIYVSSVTPVIDEYAKKDRVQCEVVGDLCEFLQDSPTKILIIGDNKLFMPFIDELRKVSPSNVNYIQSEPTYLEILPDGVSKGEALKKLAELLDIPMSEVIAIGDQLNDVSMVKAAGLGVAVANAHPDLIECADYVTASNKEDGVAEVIFKAINGFEFKKNK